MKTLHRLLLLLMVACAAQLAQAYEYFNIYFHDGTKSEPFYAVDVDSIRYSKIDIDSMVYNNWIVQEIWCPDSVYRYRIADIDSLSFKEVDIDKVSNAIAHVSAYIDPLYLQCSSPKELEQRVAELGNLEGVEKMWSDNQSLFVKICDWGVTAYSYSPDYTPVMEQESLVSNWKVATAPEIQNSGSLPIHKHYAVNNLCIVSQTTKDSDKKAAHDYEKNTIKKECSNYGLNVSFVDNPTPNFYIKGIRNYDLVLLETHGYYDGNRHWLATSEEIYSYPKGEEVDEDSLANVADNFIKNKYLNNGYSPNDITSSKVDEIRNGKKHIVCYTWVSNSFISKHKTPKSVNVVLFNVACQSMMHNDEMAKAFRGIGAKSYAGFDDVNSIGPWTYGFMLDRMLSGHSLLSAFKTLPDNLYTQTLTIDGVTYNPTLIINPFDKHDLSKSSICISPVMTLPTENQVTDDGNVVVLKGKIKTFNPKGSLYFYLSNSSNPNETNSDIIGIQYNYNENSHTLDFWASINEKELEPNKKYYYRAVFQDAAGLCLGEVEMFERQAYTVLNGETLAFYCDCMKSEREGTIYELGAWSKEMTKIVFDKSFADYRPTSTVMWFYNCENLKSIENLCYLNTSDVTNMSFMFSGCSSLTSLDVSDINTFNVTNMSFMFDGCSSLTSLDLSSFDTSNVTNMKSVFYGCGSLTSLDVSNFNTSNVTNMSFMFDGCSSLTSLDVSHFNTSNVANMMQMFASCRCLTSLDLSSFNTSNVTNMGSMFASCNSLTSLDLTSFNISNGASLGCMFARCHSLTTIYAENWVNNSIQVFYDCPNLRGGEGTKIGDNIYGYDENGTPLYYYCSDGGDAAHIDGGKDNPGLFTAK